MRKRTPSSETVEADRQIFTLTRPQLGRSSSTIGCAHEAPASHAAQPQLPAGSFCALHLQWLPRVAVLSRKQGKQLRLTVRESRCPKASTNSRTKLSAVCCRPLASPASTHGRIHLLYRMAVPAVWRCSAWQAAAAAPGFSANIPHVGTDGLETRQLSLEDTNIRIAPALEATGQIRRLFSSNEASSSAWFRALSKVQLS